MSTSPADDKSAPAAKNIPNLVGATGPAVWFTALSFYNASSSLVRSVYVPEKALSSGWWTFHSVVAVLAGLFLMLNVGVNIWDMWRNIRPAWGELKRVESSKDNDACGGEDEPLMKGEKEEDLEEDDAETLASPTQGHGQHDSEDGAAKKEKLFQWPFLLMITLAVVYAGVHEWEDSVRLEEARKAGNHYVSAWIWARLVVAVLFGLVYLGVLGLVALAVFIRRQQAKGEHREGAARLA